MTPAQSLKARIDRILTRFQGETAEYVSGINEDRQQPAIDDGEYGDPTRSTRPDFVQKEFDGWDSLITFKR